MKIVCVFCGDDAQPHPSGLWCLRCYNVCWTELEAEDYEKLDARDE